MARTLVVLFLLAGAFALGKGWIPVPCVTGEAQPPAVEQPRYLMDYFRPASPPPPPSATEQAKAAVEQFMKSEDFYWAAGMVVLVLVVMAVSKAAG